MRHQSLAGRALQYLHRAGRIDSGWFGEGLDATVSGSLNYIPEVIVGIYAAFSAGDWARARQLQQQQQAVSAVVASSGWRPVVKGIMAERGLPVGGVRAPLLPASDETVRACIAQLRALKVDLSSV